jgi:hypothetical protein
MADGASILTRCGIDTVEIARVERLLLGTPHEDLLRIFSKRSWVTVAESASPEEHAPSGELDHANRRPTTS